MVRKVVIPATISVRTVVLFSLSLKSGSSIGVSPDCCRAECAVTALCKTSRRRCFLANAREEDRRPVCLWKPRFLQSAATPRPGQQGSNQNADEPVFSADHEGESGRGADRLAPPDAACRAGSADQPRYLRLAAARLSRAEEHRAH